MEDDYQPTPAIVRAYTAENDDVPILSTPKNSVTFSRGWGDSGYKIQVVEHDCPVCGFDRMVRRLDVSPERRDSVRYWCCNPACVHFVRDSLSYATHGNYPQRDVSEPAVYEEPEA